MNAPTLTKSELEALAIIPYKDELTVKEAALYLGLAQRTVMGMVANGEFGRYEVNAKVRYVLKAELDAWKRKNWKMGAVEIEMEAEQISKHIKKRA